ncbi:hypothetical protein P175DRAFT_0431285 [Aspergillus ochraceoroseus IBT 24754]|uniref:Amino acid transporter transmembrane domain-containing protein n=1 Tax=Aspergillus ochraceoroseus IBT 24754 TaxID=1392256 RepID=A0A2T5M1G2_9EURO|nr:uncharacterized protein P175DRAFT_0431285 [Aspergillus ochraceoroseus IBT 24754]PTU22373.1 hypothetical protein P175DRAFT_0431285 [Aspergillus ochraceoroseus IBT 24754]
MFHNASKASPPASGSPSEDPFGDEREAAVKYKTMSWWQTGMIMIAETISLGILALPKVLATLGLVPGVAVIIGVGILTTYTGLVIGQFKCRHLHIHSMADAGEILLGKVGREVLAAAQLVFYMFIMGSHILTFSIMMNVLTEHSACTIIFSIIGLLVSFAFTLPRRLEELSHLSTISFISIVGAVFITIIGTSVTKSSTGPISFFPPKATAHDTMVAIANVVFAYAGHVAFFTLFSELKEIEDYPKAVALLQGSEIILYTVSAIVIYVFAGPGVASPALNSAGSPFRKIAYGIAIPTIVIGGVVNAHVAVKFQYVRLFRGTQTMHTRSLSSRFIWGMLCMMFWALAWLIGESIPVFNDILALASSLFASWFTFGLPAIFGLHMHYHSLRSTKVIMGWVLNFVVLAIGVFIVSRLRDPVMCCMLWSIVY